MIPNMSVVIQVTVVYHYCSNKQSRTCTALEATVFGKPLVSSEAVISCDDHLEKQTSILFGKTQRDAGIQWKPWCPTFTWDLKAAYISGPVRSFKPATKPYGVTYRADRPHVWKVLWASEKLRVVLDICVQRKGLGGWYYQIQELNFVRKRSVFIQVWMCAFVK